MLRLIVIFKNGMEYPLSHIGILYMVVEDDALLASASLPYLFMKFQICALWMVNMNECLKVILHVSEPLLNSLMLFGAFRRMLQWLYL